MGFGAIGGMNTAIKNNRELLSNPKRKKFKNIKGMSSDNGKPEFVFPKASPQMLMDIRKRMTFEREQRERRKVIVYLSIMVVLVTLLVIVIS